MTDELKPLSDDNIKRGFNRVEKETIVFKSMGVHVKPPDMSSRALKRRRKKNDAKLMRRAKKQARKKNK